MRSTESRTDPALRETSTPCRSPSGLLRAFLIFTTVSALTTGHVYSFRISLPGRYPRDILPHVALGLVAIVLGFALAWRSARSSGWKSRHVSLFVGSAVVLIAGIGQAALHRSGTGTADITSPPLELTCALAHFIGVIAMLVGGFRILRKEYLDRVPG